MLSLLDHTGQLTGGDADIHVRQTGSILVVPLISNFLAMQGITDTDTMSLGINALFLSIPGLDQRAGHVLGRLAGGQIVDQIGIVMLAELDPARESRR